MRIQEFVYVLLVKSGILGFGIWDTAPINDWNPESKIHKVESRIQDCLVFPPIGGLLAYFSVVIFLGKCPTMGTRNLTDTLPFLQMSGGIGLAGISR